MHLLHWNTLFYLSFHLVGFFFCMISMFGIPGQMDDTNLMAKRVMKAFNLFLNLSWIGIPVLVVCSIVAFYFEWTMIGIALSTISMSLGFAAFFCLLTLYRIK